MDIPGTSQSSSEEINVQVIVSAARGEAQLEVLSSINRLFNEVIRLLSVDYVSPNNLQIVRERLHLLQTTLTRSAELLGHEILSFLQTHASALQTISETQATNSGQGVQLQTIPSSTGRGRPKLALTEPMLTTLMKVNMPGVRIAKVLNISVRTLRRRQRDLNLRLMDTRSQIEDSLLDEEVRKITTVNKNIGEKIIKSRLNSCGIVITRHRLRESINRVDPEGVMHRSLRSNIHRRRVYSVAGSNSLWHFDGNHKLITFGIVIHGCIDGFSRAVTYVQAATNNRAQTVLDFFLSSTCEWGVPSRVRCDKGGENVLVCAFMECYRGTGRSSAIMGKSVHNCRIEQLWVDIWKDVTARYYNLFSYLASERILDLVEPKCVWALHYVFLPRLNRDLKQFQAQWNLHGLRTEHGLCPKALFLESMLNMTGSSHTAVQDFIPPEVDINEEIYGIDEENNNVDEENNSTELSIVNLEDVSCPLDATTLERVKSTINPLENRTGNPNEDDITLYTETLRIIFGNL